MLTAVILTKNEAKNLDKCLSALKFCDQILIVDDDSTDDTVKIAKSHGAQVINHALDGDFAAQRNIALSQIKSGWVLFIDADEIVSPKLSAEILLNIKHSTLNIGYLIKRDDYMWGKQLKHGDVGNLKLLRLAKAGSGHWLGQVHETWQVTGSIGELKNPLLHHPHANLADFLHRINFYSTLRAQELKSQGVKSSILQIIFYPLFKFLNLWIWKLGFADGTAGFIHAMTMAFYSFLVRGKLWLLYS